MACPMDPQLSRLVSSRGDPPILDMGLTIDRGMPINHKGGTGTSYDMKIQEMVYDIINNDGEKCKKKRVQ